MPKSAQCARLFARGPSACCAAQTCTLNCTQASLQMHSVSCMLTGAQALSCILTDKTYSQMLLTCNSASASSSA